MIQSILSDPFCLTHCFYFGRVIHRKVHVRILELPEFVYVGEVSAITSAVLSVIHVSEKFAAIMTVLFTLGCHLAPNSNPFKK